MKRVFSLHELFVNSMHLSMRRFSPSLHGEAARNTSLKSAVLEVLDS
jgi:hypothetical protein